MLSLFDIYLNAFATLLVGVILFTIGKIYQWMRNVDSRLDAIERKLKDSPKKS